MSFLNKVKKKLKKRKLVDPFFYNSFYENNSLDPRIILLESRSGGALESNILSLLKELSSRSHTKISTSHFRNVKMPNPKSKKSCVKTPFREFLLCIQDISLLLPCLRPRRLSGLTDSSFPGRFVKKEGREYSSERLAWYPFLKKNRPCTTVRRW